MRFLVAILLIFSLASCKEYRFAKKGHFIDGVDEYFNLAQQINVWLYMDYLNYDGKNGVRLDSLYPADKSVFKFIGLKGKSEKILFSAKPKNSLNYHLIAIKHDKSKFDYTSYQKFQNKDCNYYFKDFEKDFLVIRHVLIPYDRDGLLSLVYYVDKDKHPKDQFRKLNYLAEINAQELQKSTAYTNSWQIFDCQPNEKTKLTFKIRQALTKNEKVVYLKMFTLYESSQGISFAKILTKNDADSLSLSLCPNVYAIEYRNMKADLLQTDTLYISK